MGRSIDSARADAASLDEILAFLELFYRTQKELNIRLEDIWNIDETRVALGVCCNSWVLSRSRKKKAYKKTPGSRKWVSILKIVSATRKKLRLMVIFKGKYLQTSLF